jgi:hypothetical protein
MYTQIIAMTVIVVWTIGDKIIMLSICKTILLFNALISCFFM